MDTKYKEFNVITRSKVEEVSNDVMCLSTCNDTLLNSLIDSTASPKVKTTEG
jgi:hypothetical protein